MEREDEAAGNIHYISQKQMSPANERRLFGENCRYFTILDVNAPGATNHSQGIIKDYIAAHNPSALCLHEISDKRERDFFAQPTKIIKSNANTPALDSRNELHILTESVLPHSGFYAKIVSINITSLLYITTLISLSL